MEWCPRLNVYIKLTCGIKVNRAESLIYIWRHSLVVRTQGFHPCNRGSNPRGVTTCRNVSKTSHYSKLKAWVTNPTELTISSRARKLSGIKSADVRLANLLVTKIK